MAAVALAAVSVQGAGPVRRTRNVVLVTTDGLRWQEVFGGADESLLTKEAGVEEIMVIGGDDVFRAVMPMAKRIYLTEVHATPEADTWFKDFNLKDWRELSRERHEPGPKDEYPFSFVLLERP